MARLPFPAWVKLAGLGFFGPFLAGLFWPVPPAGRDRGLQVRQGWVAPWAAQEARVALVIGNGAYRAAPLKNPVNDARAVAAALRACGFTVTTLEDATRGQMRDAIRAFGGWIARGGVGLFYFAGHGMQVMGRNYLLPVGTELTREDQVEGETVGLDSVLAELETARNRLNILILDACRNNPFGTGLGGGQGFTQVDAPAGTYLAFATSPGRTAADGNGANSTYTGALLRQLKIPGLKLEEVFKRARAEVLTASSQQQTPWETSSVVGDFCFVQGQDTVPAEPAVTTVVLPPTAVPSVPAPAAATVVLPPPPVPAAQVGGLQVLVDAPGAQIYVDGSLAGSASPTEALNLPGLPAGVVRVRAEAQGCSPVQQAFGIQPGQWTQARLVLRPSPGPAFAAPEEGVPMGSPPAPPGPPPFRRPPFRPLGPRADLSLPRPVRRWVR